MSFLLQHTFYPFFFHKKNKHFFLYQFTSLSIFCLLLIVYISIWPLICSKFCDCVCGFHSSLCHSVDNYYYYFDDLLLLLLLLTMSPRYSSFDVPWFFFSCFSTLFVRQFRLRLSTIYTFFMSTAATASATNLDSHLYLLDLIPYGSLFRVIPKQWAFVVFLVMVHGIIASDCFRYSGLLFTSYTHRFFFPHSVPLDSRRFVVSSYCSSMFIIIVVVFFFCLNPVFARLIRSGDSDEN